MSTKIGLLTAFAVLAAPLSAMSADPPIVFQSHSAGMILNDVKYIAKSAGGEKAVKELNEKLKSKLGDKGFEGLDLERQILGYVQFDGKLDDVVGVLLIPVTSEKEFVGLFERLSEMKLDPPQKGIYTIKSPDADAPKVLMRVDGQYAYIAIGKDPTAALDPKNLVAPGKLYDPSEKSVATVKVHFERLPKEIRDEMANGLKKLKDKLNELPLPEDANEKIKKAVDELVKLGKRYADLLQDADTATARLILDANTGEGALEIGLTGKPGSQLAKSIASRKPSTNKFAGLITPDTVAGVKLQLPLFADEIQNAATMLLELGQQKADENVPPEFKAAIDETIKGLIRTVKDGEFDLAFSLRGPDKDGLYSLAGAVAFEDPSALEKELRTLFENKVPEMYKEMVKLDVAKVGKTGIHQVKFGDFLPAEAKKLFGAEASLTFAFAPNGIFYAFGPHAIDTLKSALEVKKSASPVFELSINRKKLGDFIQAVGKEVPPEFGTLDALLPVVAISIEGGKEMRLRLSTNIKGFEGVGGFDLPFPGPNSAKPTIKPEKK
jgi:hypothetical protein